MSDLVLGTAQLGMPYGVANVLGPPSKEEAFQLIRTAIENGIQHFDTAQEYGPSESILGNCFKGLGISKKVKVFSKINPKKDSTLLDKPEERVKQSLKKLNIDQLEGLFIQGGWSDSYRPLLKRLGDSKLVRYLGLSIYDEETFVKALEERDIQWIQIPFNILDQRALRKGWFEKAKKSGKRIFVRSVYLQGLLLLDPQCLQANVAFAKPFLEAYRRFCEATDLNPMELAFAFALRKSDGSSLILGVERESQLLANIQLFDKWSRSDVPSPCFFEPHEVPEKLINPSLWL